MGRINIEIPEDLHDDLRDESSQKQVPIKMLIIDTLRDRYADEE